MTGLGVALIVVAVIVFVALTIAVAIAFDTLMATAFIGVVVGARWLVRRSEGTWWFWPALVVAAVAVIGALALAIAANA